MANTTHTPGPWQIHEHGQYQNGQYVPIYFEDYWVAEAKGSVVGPTDPEEILANAALIAAAPDLLEALKALMPIAKHFIKNQDFEGIVNAEAAITKATNTELSK